MPWKRRLGNRLSGLHVYKIESSVIKLRCQAYFLYSHWLIKLPLLCLPAKVDVACWVNEPQVLQLSYFFPSVDGESPSKNTPDQSLLRPIFSTLVSGAVLWR